jgi:hypothetical protein
MENFRDYIVLKDKYWLTVIKRIGKDITWTDGGRGLFWAQIRSFAWKIWADLRIQGVLLEKRKYLDSTVT